MKYALLFILASLICSCTNNRQSTVLDAQTEAEETSQSVDMHNSRNSLDWSGTYRGTLPCNDCEGIQTTITLKQGGVFEKSYRHKEVDELFTYESGSFRWNDSGGQITLSSGEQYKVGENLLIPLGSNGNPLMDDETQKSYLTKVSTDIKNTYWKLIELRGQPVEVSTGMKREPYFTLKGNEQRVEGHTGCNSMNGSYSLSEPARISFSKIASTRMACPAEETEQAFLEVFELADNYAINDDTLFLNKARMAPLAKFVAVYFR
ncbi:META domain-containing protein [Roseivirga sp. BDSF3-8]|uniref:META domain-containing protein n=1 Tax=Roseivirga sp. BDSF3-8 TaxID=3241598 RepID=UPI0035323D13